MKINKNAYILRQLRKEWEIEQSMWVPTEKGVCRKTDPATSFEQWLEQEGLIEPE